MTTQKPAILPYCHFNGIPTLRDSELLGLYHRMAAEGSASAAWPYGPERWMMEMKERRSLLYVVMVDESPGGMLWLNDFRGKYAHVHLVVFREFHGRDHVEKGRFAVQSVLQGKDALGRYAFDGFVGMIPEWNRVAVAYALRCGFRKVGVVPFGHYNIDEDRSEAAVMLAIGRGDS